LIIIITKTCRIYYIKFIRKSSIKKYVVKSFKSI
ncbi:unnamed protein product, partial [marine sediment metagenome]